jgi:hypothetical protein
MGRGNAYITVTKRANVLKEYKLQTIKIQSKIVVLVFQFWCLKNALVRSPQTASSYINDTVILCVTDYHAH